MFKETDTELRAIANSTEPFNVISCHYSHLIEQLINRVYRETGILICACVKLFFRPLESFCSNKFSDLQPTLINKKM